MKFPWNVNRATSFRYSTKLQREKHRNFRRTLKHRHSKPYISAWMKTAAHYANEREADTSSITIKLLMGSRKNEIIVEELRC